MTRYIKRELIKPAYQLPVPQQEWTNAERMAGKCTRKQSVEPIDTLETLFGIAISSIGQEVLSEAEMRASIGLQDALDPARKGEASVPIGEYAEIPDDAYTYLMKKLDAQRWFSLECREILEMIQGWHNAPNVKPFELTELKTANRRNK